MCDIFENKGFERIDEDRYAVAHCDDNDDELDEFDLSPHAFEVAAGEGKGKEGNEKLKQVRKVLSRAQTIVGKQQLTSMRFASTKGAVRTVQGK